MSETLWGILAGILAATIVHFVLAKKTHTVELIRDTGDWRILLVRGASTKEVIAYVAEMNRARHEQIDQDRKDDVLFNEMEKVRYDIENGSENR